MVRPEKNGGGCRDLSEDHRFNGWETILSPRVKDDPDQGMYEVVRIETDKFVQGTKSMFKQGAQSYSWPLVESSGLGVR